MELYDVEPVRLAYSLSWREALQGTRGIAVAVTALIGLRIVLAAVLPLSFDEAYYWLWSKHLALSYYDHPPVIAYAIRMGTALFGESEFGVRAVPLLLSAGASWAVWRAGAVLLKDEHAGALACLFFNLTLMTTVETMTATPDAPLVFAAALFLLALAKLEATRDPRWWLAAGAVGGLALLSKYTALFLGAGALTWLLFTRQGRRWVATPWPWLGAAAALALFAPVIWWNAQHHWVSFRFQFGKAGTGSFAPRHLAEFVAGQIALASPFLFALAAIGLVWVRRGGSALPAALAAPSVLFFIEHGLHAPVQGNWPSFLYPVLAIAAAGAARSAHGTGWSDRLARICRRWATPVALLFLAVVSAQALTGFLPMRDPTARLLGYGLAPVGQKIALLQARTGAAGIVTTNYAPTGWLAYYVPGRQPVVQINEPDRWLAAPKAGADLLARPLLYVSEPRRMKLALLRQHFAHVEHLSTIERRRNGRTISHYDVWLLTGWRGAPAGRLTTAG